MSEKNNQSKFGVSAGLVLVFFLLAHIGLSVLGLVPSEISNLNQRIISAITNFETLSYQGAHTRVLPRSEVAEAQEAVVIGELPTEISIPKISVSAPIQTPEETNVAVLDDALSEGVVHYPGSGGIGGNRRMFLFGHSSRLPVVRNQAFRSFNGLDRLVPGDEITVSGSGSTSVQYRVRKVEVVDMNEELVSFVSGEGELTLSTCTTFGARENRIVVRAEIIPPGSGS